MSITTRSMARRKADLGKQVDQDPDEVHSVSAYPGGISPLREPSPAPADPYPAEALSNPYITPFGFSNDAVTYSGPSIIQRHEKGMEQEKRDEVERQRQYDEEPYQEDCHIQRYEEERKQAEIEESEELQQHREIDRQVTMKAIEGWPWPWTRPLEETRRYWERWNRARLEAPKLRLSHQRNILWEKYDEGGHTAEPTSHSSSHGLPHDYEHSRRGSSLDMSESPEPHEEVNQEPSD